MRKGVWNNVWLWFSLQRCHLYSMHCMWWVVKANKLNQKLFLRLHEAWNCYLWRKIQLKFIVCQNPIKLPPTLNKKSKIGAQPYLGSVIQDTPVGKSIKRCVPKIKIRVEFCLTLLTIWQNKNHHFLTFLICLNYSRKMKSLE